MALARADTPAPVEPAQSPFPFFGPYDDAPDLVFPATWWARRKLELLLVCIIAVAITVRALDALGVLRILAPKKVATTPRSSHA